MTYNIADLDIDVNNRENILQYFQYTPATKITQVGLVPHGVGVYFCDIPKDLISGLASLDYKDAEERLGYVKVDLLHNTIYDRFNTRTELLKELDKPIRWELLHNKKIVEQLPHIGSYYTLLQQLPKVDSIEKLAMFIAVIRPGKKHLIDKVKNDGWDSIKDEIWVKEGNGYQFKKSHAISYATMITINMR